ncbi:hypothetical protein [Roseibium sp. MMSF_3544]|nr:hypothetical protein [Roseibium sp. MMSF_3544]
MEKRSQPSLKKAPYVAAGWGRKEAAAGKACRKTASDDAAFFIAQFA